MYPGEGTTYHWEVLWQPLRVSLDLCRDITCSSSHTEVPMPSFVVFSSLTLIHEPATCIKIPKYFQSSERVLAILKGGLSGLWRKLSYGQESNLSFHPLWADLVLSKVDLEIIQASTEISDKTTSKLLLESQDFWIFLNSSVSPVKRESSWKKKKVCGADTGWAHFWVATPHGWIKWPKWTPSPYGLPSANHLTALFMGDAILRE